MASDTASTRCEPTKQGIGADNIVNALIPTLTPACVIKYNHGVVATMPLQSSGNRGGR